MFQAVHQQCTSQQSPSPSIDAMATLPPNALVTSNPAVEQKPRKLRASCDACSRAKVKCDKIRPTCHRCGNMGIFCNYSPSMRLGKPRKNRNPDGTIMRDVSPASSCGPLGPRPDMIPRTTSNTSESSPEPMDPFFFGPATPEYHYQDAFMSSAFEGSQSPFSDTGSFVSGWGSDDQLMFTSPTEMFTHSVPPYAPPPQSPYAGHVRSSSVQSQPEMFAPMDGLHSPPMSSPQFFGMAEQQPLPIFAQEKLTSPQPMVPAPLPTPPTSATVQSHDCTQFAFSTLNDLYAPPSSQPSPRDFNGSPSGLPTLDAVLATNKGAVDKLFVLLSCPCSANPHFSTTIAFTIMKILSWYQAIAGMNEPVVESPIETRMEAFTPTPISLGEFRLEGEDEETFRTQVVLSELRKVEKLIDKFSEVYCKNSTVADNGIDGGVYGALESLLRTRVRDTFKATMRTAPEEVKRQIATKTQQRVRANTIL